MLKFILLIVLLFFALGLAAAIMKRLMSISDRIATLQGDLKKNEMKIDLQLQKLQEQSTPEQSTQDLEEKKS